MALQKAHVFNNIPVDAAYIKISHISGTKEEIQLLVHYSADSASPFYHAASYNIVPDLETGADNFLTQAYEYLKTQDEFIGSIDV